MGSLSFVEQAQFKRGKFHEIGLDDHFGPEFEIIPTGRDLERAGFGDRLFVHRQTGRAFFVEYKSDESTFRTGNLFIETISVDDPQHFKQGWAYSCRCDYIAYYLPLNNKILLFEAATIRKNIDTWRQQYPEVKTGRRQNKTYDTHGVLLPLERAERYAARIITNITGTEYTGGG